MCVFKLQKFFFILKEVVKYLKIMIVIIPIPATVDRGTIVIN